jgi:hypothetical protein
MTEGEELEKEYIVHPKWLDELCGHCGKRFGSHLDCTSYNDDGTIKHLYSACPTVFKHTGTYKERKNDSL